MKKIIILIATMIVFMLQLVVADYTTIPELSDNFNDANITNNWFICNGVFDSPLLEGSNVMRAPQFTGGGNVARIIDDSGLPYFNNTFRIEWDWRGYNKTNFDGGDSYTIGIGANYTCGTTAFCQGYTVSTGIGGGAGSPPGETDNWCSLFIDYYDADCTYGGNVYANYTYFNDTGIPCQDSPIHLVLELTPNGNLQLSVDGNTVYNQTAPSGGNPFDIKGFNSISSYVGYNAVSGFSTMWIDNLNTSVFESPELPEEPEEQVNIDEVNNSYLALGITLFLAIWVIVALFGGNIKEAKPLIIAVIVLVLILGAIMYFLELWGRTF